MPKDPLLLELVNRKHRRFNGTPGVSYINELLLNDERIRRVILANIDQIKEFERKRGAKHYAELNRYIANPYKVWKEYTTNPKDRYLSAYQLVTYLALLDYKIEYALIKVSDDTIE